MLNIGRKLKNDARFWMKPSGQFAIRGSVATRVKDQVHDR
jgi:hypothetical protein